MEGNRRVYPANRPAGKWLSYLMLFLSAVIVLSGLVWRGDGDGVTIALSPTQTPVPTAEVFDETLEEREITLPGSTWYALQLGAFENENAAQELAQQYAMRGAAGYVWYDGRYRTLAAVYPTRDDAQYVRTQLVQEHTVDSYLFQIDLPAIRVRMSGMRGQLDIWEAAFAQANALASGLQSLSVSIDRQELSVEEALAGVQALGQEADTVSLRLKQRFAEPRHASVEGLMACFSDYAAFLDTVSRNDSAVEMSTRLKRQTLRTLELIQAVYDGLSTTEEG